MRMIHEDASSFNTQWKSGKFSHSHKILTADVVITHNGSIVNVFDPGGADRVVTMPPLEAGRFYAISNVGTANNLFVVSNLGVALSTLGPGDSTLFFASDGEWVGVSSGLSLDVFGYAGPDHSTGLVPDPGPGPALPPPDRRFLSEVGWSTIVGLGASNDYFKSHKGGAVTLTPTGAETLEFLSTNTSISILASSGTTPKSIGFTLNAANIDHDALAGFVANEHINHSTVVLTAGIGLSGGGDITTNRTFDFDPSELSVVTASPTDYMVLSTGVGPARTLFGTLSSGIDHDQLFNYVATEHIDHAGLSVIAGLGLSGGGTLTSSVSLALDINELPVGTPTTSAVFVFYDDTSGLHQKVTKAGFEAVIDHNALLNYVAAQHVNHSLVSIATTEGVQGGGTIEATRTLKLDISGLAEDTSPDPLTDYLVTWDASAGAHKKVLMSEVGSGGGGATVTTSDTPPADPTDGSLWWESDTGNLYIFYDDGTSSQWVLAVPQASAAAIGAATTAYVDAQDALRVAKAGDTMTGPLTLSAPSPVIVLTKTDNPAVAAIYGTRSGTFRWQVEYGNGISETGSNAGSNFSINRFSDVGDYLGTVLTIHRSNGDAVFSNGVTAGASGTTGRYYFGNTSTKYLSYDGAGYDLTGGGFRVHGDHIAVGYAGTVGAIYFGNTGTKTLTYDGSDYYLAGGSFVNNGKNIAALNITSFSPTNVDGAGLVSSGGYGGGMTFMDGAGRVSIWAQGNDMHLGQGSPSSTGFKIEAAGDVVVLRHIYAPAGNLTAHGVMCRDGTSNTATANYYNYKYQTGQMHAYVDTTWLGSINITSDYRIKKDVVDLASMWDTVKALRPIKYTHAEFSPPSHIKHVAEESAKARADAEKNPDATPREVPVGPFVPADEIERWGFIAHELQTTLVDSAATSVKDAPDAIQSINLAPIVAALTKALQEAMARIEALEAA